MKPHADMIIRQYGSEAEWRADDNDLHIDEMRDVNLTIRTKFIHGLNPFPFRPHDVRATSQILWLRKHIQYCALMLFSWIYVLGKQILMNFPSYDISAIVFTVWITYVWAEERKRTPKRVWEWTIPFLLTLSISISPSVCVRILLLFNICLHLLYLRSN